MADIHQVTIEPIQRIEGVTVWNWAVFGEEKLINEGVEDSLPEAVEALQRWLKDRPNG